MRSSFRISSRLGGEINPRKSASYNANDGEGMMERTKRSAGRKKGSRTDRRKREQGALSNEVERQYEAQGAEGAGEKERRQPGSSRARCTRLRARTD